MGIVTLFNGVDAQQTQHCVKMTVELYPTTELSTKKEFMTGFLSTEGSNDDAERRVLEKEMRLGYSTTFLLVHSSPHVYLI